MLINRNIKVNRKAKITDIEEQSIFDDLMSACSLEINENDAQFPSNMLKISNAFQHALHRMSSAWFRMSLSQFCQQSSNIPSFILYVFVLDLDHHKIPFRYLLLDLLQSTTNQMKNNTIHHHIHSISHINTTYIDPIPIITDHHCNQALEIFHNWSVSKKYKYLTMKEMQALQCTFSLKLTSEIINSLLDFILKLLPKTEKIEMEQKTDEEDEQKKEEQPSTHISYKMQAKMATKAIKYCIAFNLHSFINYKTLLQPVLKVSSEIYIAVTFVDYISHTFNNKQLIHDIQHYIIFHLIKYHSMIKKIENRACKIIKRWHLNIEDFPQISILKIKKFLRFQVRYGLIYDYAHMVCRENEELQIFCVNECFSHYKTFEIGMKLLNIWKLNSHPSINDGRNCVEKELLNVMLDIKKYERNGKSEAIEYLDYILDCFEISSMIHKMNDEILASELKRMKIIRKSNSLHFQHQFIQGFHDLKVCNIDENHIIFVDDIEKLQNASEILLDENVSCIGLDLELMSIDLPIKNSPKTCQIMQIAIIDKCFVFDLQCFQDNNEMFSVWDEFLMQLFSESKAVKIGMAFDGDLHKLQKQFPNALAFKSVCAPYLELAQILAYLQNEQNFSESDLHSWWMSRVMDDAKEHLIRQYFKQCSKKKEGGLAKVVRWTVGERLDKSEQLSNWGQRPLRLKQLKYAALDAVIECRVYEKLKEWENKQFIHSIQGFCDDLYA